MPFKYNKFFPKTELLDDAGFDYDEIDLFNGQSSSPLFAKALKVYSESHDIYLTALANRLENVALNGSTGEAAIYCTLFDLPYFPDTVNMRGQSSRIAEYYGMKYLIRNRQDAGEYSLTVYMYIAVDFPHLLEDEGENSVLINNLITYYSQLPSNSYRRKEYFSDTWNEDKHNLLVAAHNISLKRFYDLSTSEIELSTWDDVKDAPGEWLVAWTEPVPDTPDDDGSFRV